jgi:hypothetical protein
MGRGHVQRPPHQRPRHVRNPQLRVRGGSGADEPRDRGRHGIRQSANRMYAGARSALATMACSIDIAATDVTAPRHSRTAEGSRHRRQLFGGSRIVVAVTANAEHLHGSPPVRWPTLITTGTCPFRARASRSCSFPGWTATGQLFYPPGAVARSYLSDGDITRCAMTPGAWTPWSTTWDTS